MCSPPHVELVLPPRAPAERARLSPSAPAHPSPLAGRESSHQAGAGRHNQVRVAGGSDPPARHLEVRRGRAGGGRWILGVLISVPARPGRGYPGVAGRLGACLPVPEHGRGRRAAAEERAPVRPGLGLGSRPRSSRLARRLLLPSFLPSSIASPPPFTFPRAGGAGGRGRGGGCLGAYCWSDAEGRGRSPRGARRRGTQACGRLAGWLRAAAGVQRPRVRGMSGHWLRRAPPPRAPLRCRSPARPALGSAPQPE